MLPPSSMEDKQRICEICNRRFANGKAMGGHMRSHLAKLPLATKPTNNTQTPPNCNYIKMSTPPPPWPSKPAPPQLSSSSLRSNRSNTSTQVHYSPHHRSLYPHESIPLPNPKSSSLDRESETDSSPRNPTRKRSKRRGMRDSQTTPQQPWGFSDDEEVAMCLLKLSMDRWTKNEMKIMKPEENFGFDDDDDDDEEEVLLRRGRSSRRRKYYKCETCNIMFRSYQALGGHRASHKNKKLKICFEEQSGLVGGFECPYCDKVFESGQALGGHKKFHFSNNYLRIINPTTVQDNSDDLLDLNLPAEPEEDDDEEEVSTVSNA